MFPGGRLSSSDDAFQPASSHQVSGENQATGSDAVSPGAETERTTNVPKGSQSSDGQRLSWASEGQSVVATHGDYMGTTPEPKVKPLNLSEHYRCVSEPFAPSETDSLKQGDSKQSLTSSQKGFTPSTSLGMSIPRSMESPVGSISRKRKTTLQQDNKGCHSDTSSINMYEQNDGNLGSIHEDELDAFDDTFHEPNAKTYISPMNSVPQSISQQSKIAGRFSVSPARSTPMLVKDPLTHTRTHTRTPTKSEKSECSYNQSVRHSPDQEMQFKMSNTSLSPEQKTPLTEQAPLLDNDFPGDVRKFEIKEDVDVTVADMAIDFDDIMNYVEENQRTVQSVFSINTQDSDAFQNAPLQCGNIRFEKDTVDPFIGAKKHYLCVHDENEVQVVTEFMADYWGMRNPNIVLSVISAEDSYKPWKSQKLKDDFQKGIIKAANTTHMWVVTNGFDAGIPKIVGDAVREYNMEQENLMLVNFPLLSSSELRRRRLTVIGVVPKSTVPYGMYFDGTEGVQVKNFGEKMNADIHELNPDHTHFIMVEEEGREAQPLSLRSKIEQQFRVKVGGRKRKILRLLSMGTGSDRAVPADMSKVEESTNYIPVVGLLVQGSPRNIDHILNFVHNNMPIVVLRGSGGLADILGYVYEEIQEKAESDPDYEENCLKPELIKMIMKQYGAQFESNELAKFALRDKIIQCVKVACTGDGDHSYMSVVNIKGSGSSMKELDKYILRALFKSEKNETIGLREQQQNELQLTIDWNRPDLAWEIFQQDYTKVRIDKKMFEKALLQKDREDFIDLFLSQGVKVHKFLNHRKLKLLFEKAEDREFFVNICLEGVLGITSLPDQPLSDNFLSENLNRLIFKLSRIRDFIQPFELSMSASGKYIVDEALAERKAINCLIIWAVLMYRHKLAKSLWNKCDEPIGVALICSRINRELAKYNMEQYQRTELEENAKEFGEMALGALAICWRDSSLQAYHMLGRRLSDFNNKSTIEIAHDAGYIHFLAHPCCQKWLTKTFLGHLQIKELDWGFARLPYWFKILLSAFLIFPMYIWITFIPPKKKKLLGEDNMFLPEEDSDSDDDDDDIPITKALVMTKRKLALRRRIRSVFSGREKKKDVPFHTKIYLLWTAPITKFWTTQMFYFAFLGVFCLAVLWPTCGNRILDMIVWFWAVVIEMELVCRVYMKYHKYKTLSLLGNCIDILLIMVFLIVLLLTRIMQTWVQLATYLQARTFMCFGLIYFFYRLLGVYLPISPTLGPMLLRINRMVKHDFVAFVRMFLIFMIVGGVTIQAVLYPHWPLTTELVRRVLTRPIYAMFLTQVDDLTGDVKCSPMYQNTSDYCYTGSSVYLQSSGTSVVEDFRHLEKCPHSSLPGYLITLQYLLICKLVLVTLLFAMFALTISKIDQSASEIWKFQRYALIADFIERFSLPPPFTVFSFLYLFLKFIWRKICHLRHRCTSYCCPHGKEQSRKMKSMKSRVEKIDDTMFWKKVAREYMANEESKAEKETMVSKQGDILVSLQEDFRTHRKGMKRLNDRVVELERMIQSSRLCLEDIAHKLEKSDVMGITNVKGRFIHIAARQSPYPTTSSTRFPVFDKYVPWEVPYDVYDPKTYTQSKAKFPEAEVIYVDEDIIEIQRLKEEQLIEDLTMTEDVFSQRDPLPDFTPKWNEVTVYKENGLKHEIDRRSWICIDNQPLRYTIDAVGLPQNPMGRTGMKGKGILWRWGPNHEIKAVVTRWRRKHGSDVTMPSDYLYVEGKRVLEFISVQQESYMESRYALPGGILHGMNNIYSILCRSFMSQVYNEQDHGQFKKFDQCEMIQFFAQFALSSLRVATDNQAASSIKTDSYSLQSCLSESRTNLRTEMDQRGFSASLLYKGYLDDPRNTDNAWVEAEVWNFHYDVGDSFDYRIQEELSIKWKEVSPYVKMFGNESVIVQEAARIHDAYN